MGHRYENFTNNIENKSLNIISREDFNKRFDTNIVVLPFNLFAIGYDDNNIYMIQKDTTKENYNLWLTYISDNFIPYISTKIHPNLSCSKYYFLYCCYDGYGERIALDNDINYYNASENEFENHDEINSRSVSSFPLLHYKKYILANSSRKKEKYTLSVPDVYYISREGHKSVIDEMNDINNKIRWENKTNTAVWRGNIKNGSKYNFYNYVKYEENQREYFVKLYNSGDIKNINYSDNTMSKEDMCKHKYILDIDGHSNAWDALFWKLYSNSVVLKVDGVWEQWYYDMLKPWIHYVPIKNDFSDINEQIEWCINNDDKCKIISENATKFIIEKLNMEEVQKYVIDLFNKYIC